MEKQSIIFDLSIFLHANYNIVKKFADVIDNEKFLNQVESQINNITLELGKKYPIKEVVIAIDSGNFRKEFYDNYKGSRGESKPEFSVVKEYVTNRIHLNYDVLKFEGLEADDILYLYTQKYKPSIIVSNDNDCKLMLDEGVQFYKYRTKEYFEYHLESHKQNKYMKVLFGDDGDDVPRVAPKGCGGQWFTKMYKKYGHLKQSEFYKAVSKEKDIPMIDIVQNIHLTNYSMSIYKKYVPNINEIIEEI